MQLKLLDLFEVPMPTMPVRSRLVSLDPQGTGTAFVEALLSYHTRLAGVHVVRPNVLFNDVVLPLTDIHLENYSSNFNLHYSRTVNSYTKYGKEVSAALEKLTLREGLKFLTLIPWGGLLDPKGARVLRDHVGVCPECLDRMDAEKTRIHYPLLWYLQAVRICSVHQRVLCEHCPSCGKYQRFVSHHAMLGYCTECGAWLGTSPRRISEQTSAQEITARDRYMTTAVEEMILHNPAAGELATHERFVDRIGYYCRALTQGNMKAFEIRLGFKKNVVVNWTDKRSRPRMDLFLELCYRLNTTPVRFLSEQIPDRWAETIGTFERGPTGSRGHKDAETLGAFRDRLQAILDGPDAPTQLAAAEMLGVKRRFLNHRFPELASAISKKHQAHRSRLAAEKLADRVGTATMVVSGMMDKMQSISNRRVGKALHSLGLVLADPDVRQAVRAEISKRQLGNAASPEVIPPGDKD